MFRMLFPFRFSQWLGPLIVAFAAAVLIASIVIVTGLVDLSAAKPHPEGWARLLHYTFEQSTAFHAPDGAPPADLDSPLRIAAGAAYFGQVCARCHGGPGLGQNPVVLSMHPRPQYLVRDLPAANFTSNQLFRIVKAGVKYSAMPSWPADDRDDEVWHLVAFLRAMPKMSPATFQRLTAVGADGPNPAARAFGQPSPGRPYALRNDSEPPVGSYSYQTLVAGFAGFARNGDPVAICASCHGANGAGGGAFPNLTLQDRGYLAETLTAFASGQRRSGYMQMIASELSPGQIEALADYYAALPRVATDRPAGKPSAIGQQLALTGDKAKGLTACSSCHGIDRAAAKAYPVLEGQSRWYIANQMRVFRTGGRDAIGGANPMMAIARRMDDRQIEAVAAWYAAQPPERVQSFALKPAG
jgi:cytochrome c553